MRPPRDNRPKRRRWFLRFRLAAAWLVGALAAAGCYREASDATLMARPRYQGTDAWTVDGLALGQTFDEFKARLGEPLEVRSHAGGRNGTWKHGRLMASFDRSDRATEICGQSIQAGAATLVAAGVREAEVVQVLGAGRTQKITRPKGSGVIAIGREHTHTLHAYERGGTRFEVFVEFPADAVAYIWARRPQNPPGGAGQESR